MRVLVTGGTGVIGAGLLPRLVRAGHTVRLLTRHADDDAREWPTQVEPFRGDVTSPERIAGAAEGCDAVVHISGIVSEAPPDVTFERVNVGGTRNLLQEAQRAGAPPFVFVSSLGAERGTSAYHASKRASEELVRDYPGRFVIARPGNVYGPGDDVISMLLRMHRTLPAVPLVGLGTHRFQPIFFADAGEALAAAVEQDAVAGDFDIAGTEVTTPAAILEHFAELTGRAPATIPVPETIVGLATRVADAAGIPLPIDESKFKMLIEHNVIDPPWLNALGRIFGVSPTPLADGLAFLVDAQPEQLPHTGVGTLQRKRFWADIHGGGLNAAGLMARFRESATRLMRIEFAAEPGAPQEIAEGVTLTAALPLRGNVQVRVEEVTPRRFTFATLKGHPLCGIVRFETADRGSGGVRFSITVTARPATALDWVAMNTLGRLMQDRNWVRTVEGAIELSGGSSDGVHTDVETLDERTSEETEQEIAALVSAHRRRDNAP